MKNSYSYNYPGRNYTSNNSFIQEKNDLSKYLKNKKKRICINKIPFENSILFKSKQDQKLLNEKFSYFNKVIDRTFYNSMGQNNQINLPLYNISKINNFQTINKSKNCDNNRCNSTNNIKLKSNKNKDKINNQIKEYINKNYNRVFGNEEKKYTNSCFKLSYKINKMKKKIGKIEKIEKMNKPKIRVKETKNIKFHKSNLIKKIKKGKNHILFLDEKGNVHSLGNNYYGQLGINNNMITYQNNPICINYFYKNNILIEQIHCNKNTSFAIDRNNKLYAWGNSEYIPNYNGNIYSPKQIFIKYYVYSISQSENKMNIKYSELNQNDIKRLKNYEKKYKKKSLKNKRSLIKIRNFEDEEKEEEFEEEDLSKDEDIVEEKLGNPFLYFNNSLNEIFKLFETKNINETFDDKIKQAKNFIEKQSTYIMIDNTHPEINNTKDLLNEFYDR